MKFVASLFLLLLSSNAFALGSGTLAQPVTLSGSPFVTISGWSTSSQVSSVQPRLSDTLSSSTALSALNSALTMSVSGASTMSFICTGTFSGNIGVEVTADGFSWAGKSFSALGSAGLFGGVGLGIVSYVDVAGFYEVRLRVTSYTSGTANCTANLGAGPIMEQIYDTAYTDLQTKSEITDGTNTAGVSSAGALLVDGSAKTQPTSMAAPVSTTSTLSNSLAALNDAATITVDAYASATIQVTGTYSGSLTFEGTIDGTNWVTIPFYLVSASGSNAFTTINSGTGMYVSNIGGLHQFRVRMSAYTSGAAVVSIVAHPAYGVVKAEGQNVLLSTSSGSSNVIGTVSLGNTAGKTNVNKTSALTTTSTTANQNILSYTVTAGKTYYLLAVEIEARLNTLSTTGSILGSSTWRIDSVVQNTFNFTNKTIDEVDRIWIPMNEPIPINGGSVITVVCTPASTSSTLWQANIFGYEK